MGRKICFARWVSNYFSQVYSWSIWKSKYFEVLWNTILGKLHIYYFYITLVNCGNFWLLSILCWENINILGNTKVLLKLPSLQLYEKIIKCQFTDGKNYARIRGKKLKNLHCLDQVSILKKSIKSKEKTFCLKICYKIMESFIGLTQFEHFD